MKKFLLLSLLLTISGANAAKVANRPDISIHNIVWDSPSESVLQSMPVGGGDVGLNVWVEGGELFFYIGQSGTLDENNQMLKHGRVRLSLTPNPFDEYTQFSQTLNLQKGDLQINSINPGNSVEINFWVDVARPVIHVSVAAEKPLEVTASYESWRTQDRALTMFDRHACFSYSEYLGEITKFKDDISTKDQQIRWMHRNRDEALVRDFCIEQQGLTDVADQIFDPQTGRTFGGVMWGEGLEYDGTTSGRYISTDFTGYNLRSTSAADHFELGIALNCGQYESAEAWEEALLATKAESQRDKKAKSKSERWWGELWQRSYIYTGEQREVSRTEPEYELWQLGRNFQLFRYMQACNATGEFPSKFNGSIFTFDPKGIKPNQGAVDDLDPDYRAWGGGSFTAQNQRHVYWPMLKNGDFEMMAPQFDFYKNALSSAIARSQVYWGHDGASFTEQIENFGLPVAATWGFDEGVRKREESTEHGEMTNRFVRNHYVNQAEFAFMILQYYNFTDLSIEEYLPFIKSSIEFFDKHYRYEAKRLTGKELGEDGKLVFWPSTAAEMYKVAKNPTDVIAALKAVVSAMLELPRSYVSEAERDYYSSLLEIIPEIPFDTKQGHKVIKPAESWEYVANSEIPELYPLFPYNIYGIGKEGLEIAKNTWEWGESNAKRSFLQSWSQVGIFAARLGLREKAGELLLKRLCDSPYRFPAYFGPGVDWLPDFNHGGTAMVALQEMLMQTIDEDKIYLFPAWPMQWDVSFKLHAPKQTIVEVELRDGEIKRLEVNPKSRAKDIVIIN